MGLYASSKHALEGLSESLDHEVRDFGVRVMWVEPNFTSTSLGTNAWQSLEPIPAYAEALQGTLDAIQKQVAGGTEPSAVAARILAAIGGRYRMRHPADRGAKLLNILQRFAPAAPVDKGIRKTSALKT